MAHRTTNGPRQPQPSPEAAKGSEKELAAALDTILSNFHGDLDSLASGLTNRDHVITSSLRISEEGVPPYRCEFTIGWFDEATGTALIGVEPIGDQLLQIDEPFFAAFNLPPDEVATMSQGTLGFLVANISQDSSSEPIPAAAILLTGDDRHYGQAHRITTMQRARVIEAGQRALASL